MKPCEVEENDEPMHFNIYTEEDPDVDRTEHEEDTQTDIGNLSSRRSFSDILNEGEPKDPDGFLRASHHLRKSSIEMQKKDMYLTIQNTIKEEDKENELYEESIAGLEPTERTVK